MKLGLDEGAAGTHAATHMRTTMNVYDKAMDESKRAAHGKVVRLVLPSQVLDAP